MHLFVSFYEFLFTIFELIEIFLFTYYRQVGLFTVDFTKCTDATHMYSTTFTLMQRVKTRCYNIEPMLRIYHYHLEFSLSLAEP